MILVRLLEPLAEDFGNLRADGRQGVGRVEEQATGRNRLDVGVDGGSARLVLGVVEELLEFVPGGEPGAGEVGQLGPGVGCRVDVGLLGDHLGEHLDAGEPLDVFDERDRLGRGQGLFASRSPPDLRELLQEVGGKRAILIVALGLEAELRERAPNLEPVGHRDRLRLAREDRLRDLVLVELGRGDGCAVELGRQVPGPHEHHESRVDRVLRPAVGRVLEL